MVKKTALSLKIGIIITLMIGTFIALSKDENGSIMRAFGFLNMIAFFAGPFILYFIFSKNKTD